MRKVLFGALLLILGTGALADPWAVEEVACCYVIHPADLTVQLAEVQGVYEAVRSLWLPEGASIAEILSSWRENANMSPELLPQWKGEARLIIVFYADPNALWRDTDYVGVAGLFYPQLPRNVLSEPLAAYDAYGNRGPVFGCVALCCLPGRWEAVLAHELVHLIQYVAVLRVPDLSLDPKLFIEGMARWTEHALGYSEPVEERLEREMAAIWASAVDEFAHVPLFVVYELGASLFDRLAARLEPPEILDLFSTETPRAELPTEEFLATFADLYGESWEEFVEGWISELRGTEVTPQGELLYEYRRRGITLRTSFLWPLLSPEELEELEALNEAFYAGEASLEDLSRAESILESAWREPDEELLDSLEWRQTSLKHWGRIISGPEAAARVTKLNIIRITASPAEYVREFLDLVNRYLVFQVPSPVALPAR